jgi:hypothetical protein
VSDYISLEQQWAECNFNMAQLGDQRLLKRLKMVAAAIASDPAGSIPQQMGDWGQTKAAYRFFDHERVTFESVSQPHWNQTRLLAGESDAASTGSPQVTLLLQDTTWLSFLQHPATTGLGRFGNGSGWGLLLHSVLAVQPQHDGKGDLLGARVLGVAHAKIWARHQQVTGVGKKRNKKRKSKQSESLRWGDAMRIIGAAPPGRKFIHVGDRESDIFELFDCAMQLQGCGFVIRLMRSRNACAGHHPGTLGSSERPSTSLKEVCRQMQKLGTTQLWIEPRGGNPGRWATLSVAGGPVTVYSPWFGRAGSRTARPLLLWAVRVWEENPGPGTQPLEWLLLSSEPVNSFKDALRISHYYSLRWMIEEYHQCLKSGCKVEERQLEDAENLEPFIGIATAVAARLLQLKNDARLTPDKPASECVDDQELVTTLAKLTKVDLKKLTIRGFVRAVAKLGGFLGRKGDGEPGWKTLWHGWQKLNLIHRGYQLATQAARCG